MTYIADSDIIIRLMNGSIRLEDLPSDRPFVAPHAQVERIKETADAGMRAKILLKFSSYKPPVTVHEIPEPDSQTWERFSLWDADLLRKLKDSLEELGHPVAHLSDLLLADIAIREQLTFVTVDEGLVEAVRSLGGDAMHLDTQSTG